MHPKKFMSRKLKFFSTIDHNENTTNIVVQGQCSILGNKLMPSNQSLTKSGRSISLNSNQSCLFAVCIHIQSSRSQRIRDFPSLLQD